MLRLNEKDESVQTRKLRRRPCLQSCMVTISSTSMAAVGDVLLSMTSIGMASVCRAPAPWYQFDDLNVPFWCQHQNGRPRRANLTATCLLSLGHHPIVPHVLCHNPQRRGSRSSRLYRRPRPDPTRRRLITCPSKACQSHGVLILQLGSHWNPGTHHTNIERYEGKILRHC